MKQLILCLYPSRLPLIICLSVALLLAVITASYLPLRDFWGNLLNWLFSLGIGFLAHSLSWNLMFNRVGQTWTGNFKRQTLYLLLGMGLTGGGVLLVHRVNDPAKVGVVLIQVVVISLLVHYLLMSRGVFERMLKERQEIIQAGQSLKIKIEGKNEQIALASLMAVKVQDHYLDVYYIKDGKPALIQTYGSLKALESMALEGMEKISRSAMVNPDYVRQVEKNGKGRYLTIQGVDEAFMIKGERKELIERLAGQLKINS